MRYVTSRMSKVTQSRKFTPEQEQFATFAEPPKRLRHRHVTRMAECTQWWKSKKNGKHAPQRSVVTFSSDVIDYLAETLPLKQGAVDNSEWYQPVWDQPDHEEMQGHGGALERGWFEAGIDAVDPGAN